MSEHIEAMGNRDDEIEDTCFVQQSPEQIMYNITNSYSSQTPLYFELHDKREFTGVVYQISKGKILIDIISTILKIEFEDIKALSMVDYIEFDCQKQI